MGHDDYVDPAASAAYPSFSSALLPASIDAV
jgi:hypothetical protein